MRSRSHSASGQDESRFGLKTIVGRLIILYGVKPKGDVSWQRDNFYVYGMVEPLTGERFFWEFSHLDTVCFQAFIDLFAKHYRDALNIIQLDNGAFHTTDALVWPGNVILLAQPPYSPQLNPIERLWEYLKQQLEGQSFESLEYLMVKVESLLEGLSAQLMTSLCGWDFITKAVLSASTQECKYLGMQVLRNLVSE